MPQGSGAETISVANLAQQNATQQDAEDLGLLGGTPTSTSPVEKELPNGQTRLVDPVTQRFTKATPASPDPVAEAPPQPAPKHDAYLYQAAEYFGLSREEADEVPGPQLNKMLWRFRDEMDKVRQDNARARVHQETQVQPQPKAVERDPDDVLLDKFQDSIDPDLLGLLRRRIANEGKLRETVGGVEQSFQKREQLSLYSTIDDAFESLGADAEAVVGKGTGFELGDDSAEMERRNTILQSVARSVKVDLGTLTPKAIKAAITQAYQRLYPSRPGSQAAAPASKDAGPYQIKPNGKAPPARPTSQITEEEWLESVASPQPNGRGQELEPSGDRKAVNNLAKKLGVRDTSDDDEEILSTLLGSRQVG